MPSTLRPSATYAAHTISILSILAAATNAHVHQRSLLQHPGGALRPRDGLAAMQYVGCFSSSDGLTDLGSYTYQTSGYCQPECKKQNSLVLGLSGGSDCWCGNTFPAQSSKVDDSQCNSPCNGYDKDMCGGDNYYSIYTTGTVDQSDIPYADDSSSSSSSAAPSSAESTSAPAPTSTPAASSATAPASTTSSPSVVTSIAPGKTVVITQPAAQATGGTFTPTPSADSKSGGTNVAGIAAGVVVGVVAVAAIIGGLIFFLKRRKNQAAEEEYKRSTQVTDFMRGGREPKPPPTAHSQMSDSRLDPTAGKRDSSGSIADDQDYSRRILRVANPDSS